MNGVKLFKKFLMPCGLCAAVPMVKAVTQKELEAPKEQENKLCIRPSELPIYSNENLHPKKAPCSDKDSPPSYLEQGFGTIRKSLESLQEQLSGYTGSVTSKIDTGLEHSQMTLEYLREESSTLPRLGAVGIGGLTGLIFGLRGGKFKKFVYSSSGALAIAAVCYPRQAQESLHTAKHYVNIGYNFVYGVKPGDANQLEIKWPDFASFKVPSSLSDISNVAVGAGSAVYASITNLIKNNDDNEQSKDKPTDSEKKKEK